MIEAVTLALPRLLVLAIPAVLGALAARLSVFEEPQQAMRALNTYALYFGFPALIAAGLMSATLTLPSSPLFYLAWPLVLWLILGALRMTRGAHTSTLALVTVFGNVAYLGLPYVLSLYDASLTGAATLIVAVHVTLAVTLGPWVLAAWSGESAPRFSTLAASVAKQPLFWAPFAGLACQLLPEPVLTQGLAPLIKPMAASAAPVALFLLGMHLHEQRARLVSWHAPLLAHLLIRQAVAPLLMLGLMVAAHKFGWIEARFAGLHVILAAMPVAITTFSMAHQCGHGEDVVGASILWSTLLSLLLLPLWTALVMLWFGV